MGPGLWDPAGHPLGKEVRKPFRTLAEDRVRIELKEWKVSAPAVGTKQPGTLAVPQPMDVQALQGFVTVTDAKGGAVKGRVTVGAAEKTWAFHPEQPWRAE